MNICNLILEKKAEGERRKTIKRRQAKRKQQSNVILTKQKYWVKKLIRCLWSEMRYCHEKRLWKEGWIRLHGGKRQPYRSERKQWDNDDRTIGWLNLWCVGEWLCAKQWNKLTNNEIDCLDFRGYFFFYILVLTSHSHWIIISFLQLVQDLKFGQKRMTITFIPVLRWYCFIGTDEMKRKVLSRSYLNSESKAR